MLIDMIAYEIFGADLHKEEIMNIWKGEEGEAMMEFWNDEYRLTIKQFLYDKKNLDRGKGSPKTWSLKVKNSVT